MRAVAVGNGTHGRETEAFVKDVLAASGLVKDGAPFCVAVSEAGASVYSASEVAREEFPDLDLTIRGAISIARRLQDPLAELVKVDPKSIGVGQYQHDVFQPMLQKKLEEVVESCVNSVGVEVNTASAPLLARVAGIGPMLSRRIVAHRNQNGAFKSRKALLEVPGLGAKTYEQAAGFLRIRGGEHPLDSSAVHPERYALVERMATDLGVPVVSLIGNAELLKKLDLSRYVGGDVGAFTLDDIQKELVKPGRDPRQSFEPPQFRDDVRTMEDLKQDMVLEGVVTNVTAFGAFVDVGVHQDGLVHVSQLADRFVKEASEVVKVGDRIKVRVLEVDLERRRIALSAKQGGSGGGGGGGERRPAAGSDNRRPGHSQQQHQRRPEAKKPQSTFSNNPFAAHFNRK
ncbi:MAG TPA: helix-hairpin-helix domain-containing protein [Polyangiaceae bacterium]|nr:helix-hairpin-helix domain-containing protein [Polyangiaceae bacterium]